MSQISLKDRFVTFSMESYGLPVKPSFILQDLPSSMRYVISIQQMSLVLLQDFAKTHNAKLILGGNINID